MATVAAKNRLSWCLELSRLHVEVHLAVIAQVRRGLGELPVVGGSGLGVSRHFGVISAESVVQAASAVLCKEVAKV